MVDRGQRAHRVYIMTFQAPHTVGLQLHATRANLSRDGGRRPKTHYGEVHLANIVECHENLRLQWSGTTPVVLPLVPRKRSTQSLRRRSTHGRSNHHSCFKILVPLLQCGAQFAAVEKDHVCVWWKRIVPLSIVISLPLQRKRRAMLREVYALGG